MPICVYVNTNTPITGNLIPLFGAHVGHAAMGFVNLESIAGVSDFYISWYPATDGAEQAYKLNYKRGKVQAAKAVLSGTAARNEPVQDFWSEPESFRRHCTKVFLPCIGEIPDAPGVGLNAKRMEQWWNISKENVMSKFSLISKSKNCAATVMAALWAGGSESYESYSRVVWVTPRNVLSYAKHLRKQIDKSAKIVRDASQLIQIQENGERQLSSTERKKVTKFSSLTQKLEKARPIITEEGATQNDCGKYDLMTYDTWVGLSKVEMSWSTGFARRKEQIKNIDRKLVAYHGISWKTHYAVKAKLLVEMLQEVRDHMTQKAHSQRANAVMILAGQLITVFKSVGEYEKIHNDEMAILRRREIEIANANVEVPKVVVTEQEKLERKAMILLRKCYECSNLMEEHLRMHARAQLMLYTSPNYGQLAKKDDSGHILITKENLDAIPDEMVSDSDFNSKNVMWDA